MQAQKYRLTAEESKLFQEHIKTVPYTIYTYFNYQKCKDLGYLDIENAGYLGLVYAIKTYDQSREMSFLNWAIKNVRYNIIRYMKAYKETPSHESIEDIRESELRGCKVGSCRSLVSLDYITPHIETLDDRKMVAAIKNIAKTELNERMYNVYEMYFLNEIPVREIAQYLNCTKSYVYETINKIVIKIKKELKNQGLIE